MNFHEKYWIFKVHFFLNSDVRFNALACTCMNFHKKILNFQSSLFSWFRCKIQCIVMHLHEFFIKKYWTFKVHFFLGSDVRFNALLCTCMNFHKKYWTFKFNFFLGSEVRFNALAWIFMKNIELSKFTFFLVQMWDSMHCHALA